LSGWISRYSHDTGESVDNFGVISGCMGGFWLQCEVQDWGRFYVTEVAPVPEPATIILLSLGIVGLVGVKKKFNNGKNKD